MNNEYKIVGKIDISDKRKDELNSYVLQLFKICGIRKIEKVKINKKTIKVVSYPFPDADGIVSFNYSVFEKKERKNSYFDTNTCQLNCTDRGVQEYGLVMNLLMTMQIAYSESSCVLTHNGAPCDLKAYTACIKQLTGLILDHVEKMIYWDYIPKQLFWKTIKTDEGYGRLEFMTIDELVRFPEMIEIMANWKKQYSEIPDLIAESVNIEVELADILVLQKTVWDACYTSKAMIEEFRANAVDTSYKKAIYLYKQIIDEDVKAFPEMTRNQVLDCVVRYIDKEEKKNSLQAYAALLCNIGLRRRMFGF